MNITLTPELVDRKVKSGRYNSAGEVVREALELLDEKDRIKDVRLEELRAEIMKAEDDFNNSRFIEIKSEAQLRKLGEDIIHRGHERLAVDKNVRK